MRAPAPTKVPTAWQWGSAPASEKTVLRSRAKNLFATISARSGLSASQQNRTLSFRCSRSENRHPGRSFRARLQVIKAVGAVVALPTVSDNDGGVPVIRDALDSGHASLLHQFHMGLGAADQLKMVAIEKRRSRLE